VKKSSSKEIAEILSALSDTIYSRGKSGQNCDPNILFTIGIIAFCDYVKLKIKSMPIAVFNDSPNGSIAVHDFIDWCMPFPGAMLHCRFQKCLFD
jgi:hypothetical protein